MKKDRSRRDENKDRSLNRYHLTPIPMIECDPERYIHERIWNGCIVRVLEIFGQQFINVNDIRDASGPCCHNTAEEKDKMVRVNGNNRYVNGNEFLTHRTFPNAGKTATGSTWWKWAESGFKSTLKVSRNPAKGFMKNRKWFNKPEESAVSNTYADTTELFSILVNALQDNPSAIVNTMLLTLMTKLVDTMEEGGSDVVNKEIADLISVELPKERVAKPAPITHMTPQAYAVSIGLWGELGSMYHKGGAVHKAIWTALNRSLKAATLADGLEANAIVISQAKLKEWVCRSNKVLAFPLPVLGRVFKREFKNVSGTNDDGSIGAPK